MKQQATECKEAGDNNGEDLANNTNRYTLEESKGVCIDNGEGSERDDRQQVDERQQVQESKDVPNNNSNEKANNMQESKEVKEEVTEVQKLSLESKEDFEDAVLNDGIEKAINSERPNLDA